MNEIQRTAPAPAPAPARRPARRVLLIGVPVTAAALAGAFAFTALTNSGGNGTVAATPPPVEAPVVRIEPGSTAQLASTVERIAAAASASETPEPGPGRPLLIKSKVSYLSVSHTDADESKTLVEPLHIREVSIRRQAGLAGRARLPAQGRRHPQHGRREQLGRPFLRLPQDAAHRPEHPAEEDLQGDQGPGELPGPAGIHHGR